MIVFNCSKLLIGSYDFWDIFNFSLFFFEDYFFNFFLIFYLSCIIKEYWPNTSDIQIYNIPERKTESWFVIQKWFGYGTDYSLLQNTSPESLSCQMT